MTDDPHDGSDLGDDPADDLCPVCGHYQDWQRCTVIGCDDGYVDEHDDDPVNYAEGEEYYPCPECRGRGGYWICTGPEHTEEQVAAYRAKVEAAAEPDPVRCRGEYPLSAGAVPVLGAEDHPGPPHQRSP